MQAAIYQIQNKKQGQIKVNKKGHRSNKAKPMKTYL